jgi:opacity protein-like surface antigen
MASDLSGDVFPPFTSPIGPIGGPTTARLEGNVDILQARVMSYQGHFLIGAGFFAVDSDQNLTGSSTYGPFADTVQERESGLSIILGLQWDVGNWGIRGEYAYFDTDGNQDIDLEISTFGVGFLYQF